MRRNAFVFGRRFFAFLGEKGVLGLGIGHTKEY